MTDQDPCAELLERIEDTRKDDMVRMEAEMIAVALIWFMTIVFIALSVAISVTEALATLPSIGVLGVHHRHAIRHQVNRVIHRRGVSDE